MRLDKMGLTIITKAPQWNMYVYNEMNHNFINLPYERWRERFIMGAQHKHGRPVSELEPIATKVTRTVKGYPATQYLIKQKLPTGQTAIVSELWLTKSLLAPTQLKQVFHSILNTPDDFRGVPLSISRFQNGRMVPVLEAYRINKTSLAPTQFALPQGYKEVKDELALMFEDPEQTNIDRPTTPPPAKSH
jgi:hypothetical protein